MIATGIEGELGGRNCTSVIDATLVLLATFEDRTSTHAHAIPKFGVKGVCSQSPTSIRILRVIVTFGRCALRIQSRECGALIG
jgi:hypothetical protein